MKQLIGNEQVKTYLTRMVEKDLVGNSLLFAGPDGVGKSLFALEFAKLILQKEGCSQQVIEKIGKGSHPDMHIMRPEGKVGMHSIESLREFSQEVYLEPYEAKRKFFIIHDADRMLPSSANALLKTFEEPSLDSVIILLSSSPDSLLTTIKSRCRALHFHSIQPSEIEKYLIETHQIEPEKAKEISFLADGSIGNAIRFALHEGGKLRQQVLQMLVHGPFSSYKEFSESIKQIAEQVEAAQRIAEEETGTVLEDSMTAVQKQALEKELAGTIRMKLAQEAKGIFEVILSWYRDKELLQCGGNDLLLSNPDYRSALNGGGSTFPLSFVQQIVKDAETSLDRSTSLQIVMETLFLKLRYL